MSDEIINEKLWTIKELAAVPEFNITAQTWRRMVKCGNVQCIRVGSGRGLVYIPDSEVQRVFSPLPKASVGPAVFNVSNIHSSYRPGFIYLFHWNGFYKIGLAQDVAARFNAFSTLPIDVENLHSFTTDYMAIVESYLHQKFAEYRTKGEWFQLPSVWACWAHALTDYELDPLVMGYKVAA
jgi:hypothetical protein